jgi:hypothetical protein
MNSWGRGTLTGVAVMLVIFKVVLLSLGQFQRVEQLSV